MTILRRTLSTIGFCSILILSCSKHKDSEAPSIDPCDKIVKVETYNAGNLVPYATIEYDGQGRVKHVTGEGLNTSIYTYTYYKDSIVLSATDTYGNNIGLTYFLDEKGRVKGTSYFDYQYTYNADGYLVSYRQPYTITNNQIAGYIYYTLKYENNDLTEIITTENTDWKKINFRYYDEANQDLLGKNQPLYTGGVLRTSINAYAFTYQCP
jgi:hypothetical protein